ncbi:hypothetical protein CUMW_233450 [Citrus unshiu]|uniref:Aminotransferase-like plant mobile domain-containing protein n=2 Tax=Citrus TaxID=2706 RepID=A0A2H5QIG7_CITUN|nr:hypothetical protein CUMW_233450 [Citrus unshiu]
MKVGEVRKRKCRDVNSLNEDMEGNRTIERNTHYGFISYFGATVRKMKATDANTSITREVRREIATSFKNLPPKMKWKYKVRVEQAVKGEATNTYFTRCAPDRLAVAVTNLSDEQRAAVCEMGMGSVLELNSGRLKRKLCGWLVDRIDVCRRVVVLNGNEVELSANSFGHVMGLIDGGMPLRLQGDIKEVESYVQMFSASSTGINIKKLAEMLSNSTAADDRFKVTFMLFTLYTVLCPPGGVHISCNFLFSLKDVNCIQKRNWATFCFHKFLEGITRYKEEKLAYIGGCLLYLEMLYFNSIVYGKVQRDRSMCPLALWNVDEIKRSGGCSMPVEEDFRDSDVRQMTTAPGMTKIKSVSQLDKAVVISSRPSGYVEKLKTDGSCRNNHGNNDKGKDWSDATEGEGICTNCESKQLYKSAASGSMYQNNEIKEKDVCEDAQHMDLIDVADFVMETQTSPPCSESLHSNIRIEEPAVVQKCSEPNKKTGNVVHPKSPLNQIGASRARYRVGPYVMQRPLSTDDEMLINFCMDENLNKGEIVFKTNFNCISRHDIMSLSPRSTINVKLHDNISGDPTDLTFGIKQFISGDLYLANIGSCKQLQFIEKMALQHCGSNCLSGRLNMSEFVIQLCTRQASIRNESDCALYVMLMMERHKMWSCLSEAEIKFDSDSERARILIDLMTYSFNCLKDNVRLKAEKHRSRVDDEAHSIYEAIEKKRVRQLRSASQMGHGRRH